MNACKARQVSDQMSCADCALVWDMNDPEPPDCPRVSPAIQHDADFAPVMRAVIAQCGTNSPEYAALLRGYDRARGVL